MSCLTDTLQSILGEPAEKHASLADAVLDIRRVYSVEKAVEKALSKPEKGPSKASVGRALDKIIKGVKTASTPPYIDHMYEDKTASLPGQDLRMPVMGGTKMPTADSKSFATKNLNASKSKAEVGPAPLMSKLKPKGPNIQEVAPKMSPSTAGSLPKIGYVMQNDPLIQYLKKQAMSLEDNKDNAPRDKNYPEELTTSDPSKSTFSEDKGPIDIQAYLSEKFDTSKGHRQKYLNKDYAVAAGLVNKVLKK